MATVSYHHHTGRPRKIECPKSGQKWVVQSGVKKREDFVHKGRTRIINLRPVYSPRQQINNNKRKTKNQRGENERIKYLLSYDLPDI